MGFYDMAQNELNKTKTITTNGAVAYETSGKQLLDYHFHVTSYRSASDKDIADAFAKAFYEDKMNALRYGFYLGDIRGGLGERHQFKAILKYLAENQPKAARVIAKKGLIPEYNRYDSMWVLLDYAETKDTVIDAIQNQLNIDYRNMENKKPISLIAKWLPSENASSRETKRKATIIREGLGMTPRAYRKMLVELRQYLDIVECKMSAKKWSEINYETVPSKANLIYSDAFLRNDENRRRDFLSSVSSGQAKINAGVLYPHEIVNKYQENGDYFWTGRSYGLKLTYNETYEQLWQALPKLQVEDTLVVRDGSGSMTSVRVAGSATPLDVATGLSIYMSENNSDNWKDKFITFSSKPKVIDLKNCKNLKEKLEVCHRENDCSNTDIYKTMKLVLDTAVSNHLTQEQMPGMILIISDMQFDGRYCNFNKTLFENISGEFEQSGYHLPRICFWNVAANTYNTVPMVQNDYGLILCSGFSTNLIKMFMSNKVDPYEVLLDTIHDKRYDAVEEALAEVI